MARTEITKTIPEWLKATKARKTEVLNSKIDALYNKVADAINNGEDTVALDEEDQLGFIAGVNQLLLEKKFKVIRGLGLTLHILVEFV